MGKPAARIGDLTAHGGTVTVGKPTILIGKMPASTMGDMHVCPMVTGVVPHVGGPVTLGSTGVLVSKVPAARVSDITVCAGPPSMPAMGCMTVLLGEAGSGSQAGNAAAAAAAASASVKSPKAIKPFPVAEPPEPRTENHYVECEVVDSAGLPITGIPYKLKDPDGNDVVGSVSPEGKIRHDGYAQSGSFKVELCFLANAKWSKSTAKGGEELTLKCESEGFADGTPATVLVMEERDGGRFRRVLKKLTSKVSGNKVEAKWTLAKEDYPSGVPDAATGDKVMGRAEYFFLVEVKGVVAFSDRAIFNDNADIKLVGPDGEALPEAAYELRLHDGTVRKGKADKQGKASEKDVPVGPYIIVLPEIVIKAEAPKKEEPKAAGAAEKKKPKWMGIAEGELGQAEIKGKKHNDKIVAYHASTKKQPKTDEVPWCSSFVNWVMKEAGFPGTESSWAKDWAKYGKKLDKPAVHSIAVIDWGKDDKGKDKGGHVGFVVGKKKDRIVLLGGNQGDSVSYSSFPKDKIMAYVVPEGFADLDYELPEIKKAKGTSYAATR